MNLTLQIELATLNDLPKLALYDAHIPSVTLAGAVRDRHVYLLRDTSSGQVFGVLRFAMFRQAIPFLELLYLDARVRGRGYGTMMMRYWEGEMKQLRYAHVMTSTQSDEDSWRFFEKLGYRRAGDFLSPGRYTREWMYVKAL